MKKILLVEDCRHLSEEIETVLRMEGFHVTCAINALQALVCLNTFTPDVIITDINMPWMNGFEFIIHIRAGHTLNLVPIIILSANGSELDRLRGAQAGANIFIQKPCKIFVLIEAITSLLE